MKKSNLTNWVVVLVPAVLASSAAAQTLTGISGSGNASLKKDPQTMRLKVDLLAKGKDLKEALEKLKTRREAVAKKVTELGATPDSIKFGPPKIMPQNMDQRRQMAMMVQARLKGGKAPAEKKKEPVKVLLSLQAEWPMKGGSPEERLLLIDELMDKVRDADLAGKKEAEELTPEEKEAAEEAEGQEQMNMYSGEQAPQPGEPIFLFVAKASDEERAKLLVEAFNKAKTDAARMAQAAGVKQGPLSSIANHENPGGFGDDFNEISPIYRSYMYQMMQQSGVSRDAAADEIVGVDANQVSLQITVIATFAIN